MADVTAIDSFNQMKHNEKGTTHHQEEHHEGRLEVESEESNTDLEKHASPGTDYDLSHVQTEEGEYVVTAKTWVVVVVSYQSSVTALYS